MDDDNVNIEDDDDDEKFENIKDDDDEDDDTLPRLQVPTIASACKPLTSIIEILLLGGGGSETPFGSCTMLRLDRIYSTSLSPSSMASHCRSDRPKFLLCVAF